MMVNKMWDLSQLIEFITGLPGLFSFCNWGKM